MADGAMTVQERDAFLAAVHVGVLAIDEPGRGPLALPIWYQYADGTVTIHMDEDTLKVRLLRAAGRATMTAQTEQAPYQYVSVEGPVVIEPRTDDGLDMAARYLGPELGKWYIDNNPTTASSVVAKLHVEHWRTTDFAKLLAGD